MQHQPNDVPPADLITPRQAARILRRHVSTIFRWIHTSRIRAWKVGTERFSVSEAEVRAQVRRFRPAPLPAQKDEVNRDHEAAIAYLRAHGVIKDGEGPRS